MIWFFIAVWFCVPIMALAYFTAWLTLVWLAVHIALAKRGTRQWVFLEYGLTSMALWLFLICFSAERLIPLGLAVVILQALLLAVLESKARKRWLSHGTEME